MSSIIVSPAGDPVEVLDDAEFAVRLGVPYPGRAYTQLVKPNAGRTHILRALWRDGAAEDRSGRATALLAGGPGDTRSTLALAPMRICVDRRINGKRTYYLRLVALPERWLADVDDERPTTLAEPSSESGAPADPPVADPGPDPDHGGIAVAVAAALLEQVSAIILAGNRTAAHADEVSAVLERVAADRDKLEQRLGQQVAYVDKLRRDYAAAGDTIGALTHERDGLRRRVRELEHNLSVATSSDTQRVIDAEVRKQLDLVMRQAPGSQHAP